MFTHKTMVRCLLATLAICLGLAGPALAAEQVPFRGSLDGVVTATPVNPPVFFVVVDATGAANQLGAFTLTIPHLVDRSTRIGIGSYVFTAANGDTLTADFTGQAFLTATPGVLHVVEIATITGGTGRFANATGSFITDRIFDSVAGTTTGTFTGTISTPGANNP